MPTFLVVWLRHLADTKQVEADGAAALSKNPSYYTIVPDAFIFGNRSTANATGGTAYRNPTWNASSPSPPLSSIFTAVPAPQPHQFPVVIDSGTTLSFLPATVARGYAMQVPGPVGVAGGIYWAACDAEMPRLGSCWEGGRSGGMRRMC